MNTASHTRLRSGRGEVVLHALSDTEGLPLLALHALGETHAAFAELTDTWPGALHALDFAGHGASERCQGRAYAAESWVGDADAALRHVGPAAVLGVGVGAYVALMLAAARPELARATLLAPGPGLAGTGEFPDERRAELDRAAFRNVLAATDQPASAPVDPMVFETNMHHRPATYAARFAADASALLLADDGEAKPPWWVAVAQAPSSTAVGWPWKSALPRLHQTATSRTD